MRLAVFTNQFPGRINTFFARDIAPILRAGIEVDIFPFYPLEPTLWHFVPDILGENVLPRSRVHHITLGESVCGTRLKDIPRLRSFVRDAAILGLSATRFGVRPLAKTLYVALKGFGWAQQSGKEYDHILAYWGNYAASSAYIFSQMLDRRVPYSIFLHAGIDLYETPVYLQQKLLSAHTILTCSDFNRDFIRDRFPAVFPAISGKIYVHRHGVDLSEFRFEAGGRPPRRILALGGLHEYKGFDYLLRAVRVLTVRGFDCEIQLVGDGDQAAHLKALAVELGIEDRVRFTGWLPPGEVATVMRRATVLVHPSSRLADGVPNVIKEAMAVGTPVIASRVAGIPELLGDGQFGKLVPPRDVSALASAIQTLLTDEALRLRYASSARQHVEERYDVWRNGELLAAVLTSAADRPHLRPLVAANAI